MTIIKANNDNTIRFWFDNWTGDTLNEKFSQLYSFVKKPKCSIRFFLDQDTDIIFSLPLSVIAAEQLDEVNTMIFSNIGDDMVHDSWSYI